MSENEQQIDSIFKEMESFLKSQAREEPIPSQPLYLRTEYKTSLKLTDSEKNVFPVEESFLSAFRETYTDKACTPAVTQSRWCGCTTGSSSFSSWARSATRSR